MENVLPLVLKLPLSQQGKAMAHMRRAWTAGYRQLGFWCEPFEPLTPLHYLDLAGKSPEGLWEMLPSKSVIDENP
ncbi:MAG TPA: hypothetical protein VD994_10025 [Prosthecobacter sp.]|nr:hypothetical protein [Prosthecobacter sp.]